MLYSFSHDKLRESYHRSVVSKSPNFCDWWDWGSALLISSLTPPTSSSSFWLSAPSVGSVSVSSPISYCVIKKSIRVVSCWKLSWGDPPTLQKPIQKFATLLRPDMTERKLIIFDSHLALTLQLSLFQPKKNGIMVLNIFCVNDKYTVNIAYYGLILNSVKFNIKLIKCYFSEEIRVSWYLKQQFQHFKFEKKDFHWFQCEPGTSHSFGHW